VFDSEKTMACDTFGLIITRQKIRVSEASMTDWQSVDTDGEFDADSCSTEASSYGDSIKILSTHTK